MAGEWRGQNRPRWSFKLALSPSTLDGDSEPVDGAAAAFGAENIRLAGPFFPAALARHEVGQERAAARKAAAMDGVTLLDDDAVELAGVDAAPDRPTGERTTMGRLGEPATGAALFVSSFYIHVALPPRPLRPSGGSSSVGEVVTLRQVYLASSPRFGWRG